MLQDSRECLGLIPGHNYILTDIREVVIPRSYRAKIGMDRVAMVRLRNPWGGQEWTGSWSEG